MIFRDINTGNLLNIRRNDYTNDRLFYSSIMKSTKIEATKYKTIINSSNSSSNTSSSINNNPISPCDYIPSWVNDIISLSHNNNA
jgi:hypothetical protein